MHQRLRTGKPIGPLHSMKGGNLQERTSFVNSMVQASLQVCRWTLYHFTMRVPLPTCKLGCTLAICKACTLLEMDPFHAVLHRRMGLPVEIHANSQPSQINHGAGFPPTQITHRMKAKSMAIEG